MKVFMTRALHFFIKMVVIITVVFALLYFAGLLDMGKGGLFHTLFQTTKGWLTVGCVVLVSVAYPLLSFTKVSVRGDFDSEREILHEVMGRLGYSVVAHDIDRAEYRTNSIGKKLFNQFDDRVVVERDGSYITVSGLKKEVLRIEPLFVQCRLNGGNNRK